MIYKTSSAKMQEHVIEEYFVDRVDKVLNGIAEKFTSPGRRGVPDRDVMLPFGIHHYVELKTATGRLSKLQKIDHAIRRRLGHTVYVLRSKADVDCYIAWPHGAFKWKECQT